MRISVWLMVLLLCAPAVAQVSVTLPAVPFRPFAATLAASQVELSFNLDGPVGSYTINARRSGQIVASTIVIKNTPPGTPQTFRVGVPISEGQNQFQVEAINIAGIGVATSPLTTSIGRELKNTVSRVSLDAILPFTRTTTATSTDLIFTVSGNAQTYEVSATNSFGGQVITTALPGPGEGIIRVPLTPNSPNIFTLLARATDPPFAIPNQATSNALQIVQDTQPPTITSAAVTFPPLPTGDTIVTVQGTTEAFADVFVDNTRGDVFQGQADILGQFRINGIFLPLVPPGPTTTNLRLTARDAAGNVSAVTLLPATRNGTDPRFDFLQMTPRDGSFINGGRPVVVRGAVGERTEPYTVIFGIKAGSGSFATEERLENLQDGDSFNKDIVLSSLISDPGADVVYSIEAQVASTGTISNPQLLGDVTLDNTDPPAPGLASRFGERLFTRSRLLQVDGTGERFATVEFEQVDALRFRRNRAIPVESTPVVDGGEFTQVLDLNRLSDGDLSVNVSAIATSGRTAASSVRQLLVTRDTRAPQVTRLEINGTAEGQSRPIFLRAGQLVTLRVTLDEPMSRAPDVFVTERGLDALPAPLSASVTGGRIFEYTYATTPNPNVVDSPDDISDGPVEIVITGGADRAGNPVDPEARFLGAFVKDSLPPTLDITRTTPPSASTVNGPPDPLSIQIVENPLSVEPPSGVDIDATTVRVFGPQETSPGTERSGQVTPFSPTVVHFRFNDGQFVTEGTYRFIVTFRDNAGNTDSTSVFLRLDSSSLDPRFLIASNPPNLASVNRSTMPTDARNRDFVASFFEPAIASQIDLATTTMAVSIQCPVKRPLAGTTERITGTQELRFVLANKLRPVAASDPLAGDDDGVYVVETFMRDTGQNLTPNLFRTFTYDTTPPFVLDNEVHSVGSLGNTTENQFFPQTDAAVNGPLRTIRAGLVDGVAANGFTGSGINTSQTTGSSISLTLVGRFPTTTLAVGSSTANTPDLTSTIRFESIEPRVFSPCFAGLRRANILLDLRTNSVSSDPQGLTTGGAMDGLWEIAVTPVDAAGNRGLPSTSRFVYDTIPPTVLLDSVQSDQFITSNVLTLTGTTFDEAKPPNDFGLGVRTLRVRVEQNTPSQVTTTPPLIDWTEGTLSPNAALTNAATPLKFAFTGVLPRYVGKARIIVRATDKAGNNRDVIRDVNVQTDLLPAPRLRTPPDNSAVASQVVTFTWSQVVGASRYRVIATDPLGNQVSKDVAPQFNETTLSFVDRPQGDYTWTVQAVDTQGVPGSKPFAFRFRLDTVAPAVTSLFAFDPTLPENRGGNIIDAQIRVGIRFSEAMDTTTTPTVVVQPANPNAPPRTLTQLLYENDQWRGLVKMPPTPDAPDVNGLARITVSGARDRAGNLIPPTSQFFEIAIGPFFEIRAFSNPVNKREILFHFKSLRQDGGPAETLTAPPFARVTQLSGTPKILEVHKLRNSVWAGPYSLDPTRPGTAVIDVNGTDTAGNASTRQVRFDIQTVVGRARAGLRLPGAPLALDLPENAVANPETVILLPAALVSADASAIATASGSAELIPVAALGGIYPAIDLAQAGQAHVDLRQIALPAGVDRARVGLYRLSETGVRIQPGQLAGDQLNARVDGFGAMALLADVKPPVIASPLLAGDRTEVRFDTERPDLELSAADGGSGVDLAGLSVTIDGQAATLAPRTDAVDAGGGTSAVFRAAQALTPGAHEVRLAATDRAGNTTVRTFRGVAPEPFGISELVPYPNPCRTSSRLRYRLTRDATDAEIKIYDTAGRLVTTLDAPVQYGRQDVTWDLVNDRGRGVANGVYLVRMKARGAGGEKVKRDTKLAVQR